VDQLLPRYDEGGLAGVMPAVARTLGVRLGEAHGVGPGPVDGDGVGAFPTFPAARRAVVVLVDGLGYELVRRRGGHAPFLRSLLPAAHRITAGFPSTTATSMGTFGTGLPPGAHGLLGYEVLVPGEDRLLNELSWENGPDPLAWQPEPTVFELAQRDGVSVTSVGPAFFDGSGLTRAALRGGRFAAADDLPDRVDATLTALRAERRSLVYLYWGELDKVGHVHGCQSWEWGDQLEAIDAELARLVRSVPSDTAVFVTADHGMVDAPHALRIDLAHDEELARGVRHVGGEPRALQLYCEDGALADVTATWLARVGERAWVRTRAEAVA
jgi:predicted AlkP superfamily pyrophosphatase or phosphodiesterase